jgi:recombinational DNA repair protein RecR
MTPLISLGLLTTGVGAAMIRLGLARGLLESRVPRRRCPSCGRLIEGAVCRVCAGDKR